MSGAAGTFKRGTNAGTARCNECGTLRQRANIQGEGTCNECWDKAGDQNSVSDGYMTCADFQAKYNEHSEYCDCKETPVTDTVESINYGAVVNPDGTPTATTIGILQGHPQLSPIHEAYPTGIPDISAHSNLKQLSLLKCWLGAAKGTEAAHAKYDDAIRELETRVYQDQLAAEALKASVAADKLSAKRTAQAEADEAKAARKAERDAAYAERHAANVAAVEARKAERQAAKDAKAQAAADAAAVVAAADALPAGEHVKAVATDEVQDALKTVAGYSKSEQTGRKRKAKVIELD